MPLDAERIAEAVLDGVEPTLEKLNKRIRDLETRLAAAETKAAQDPIGLAGGFVDGDGQLVLTTTKGDVRQVGKVRAEPGKDADNEAILAALRAEIAEATSEAAFERRVAAEVAKRLDLAALAQQAAALVPKPADGESVEPETVERMVAVAVEAREAAIVARVLAGIRQPEGGRSVDPDVVKSMVAAEVKAAVDALPPAEPGRPGADAKAEDIERAVTAEIDRREAEIIRKAAALIPPPEPGAPADPEVTHALVLAEVRAAVDAIPRPRDGMDVKPEAVEAMVKAAVAAIPAAKDGVGLAGALIDRSGELVVTLTDGTTKTLGPVVGRDADMAALERLLLEKVAAIPAPRDGVDGLGFDDLTVEYDGERGFVLRFVKGERVKEFAFTVPIVLDRGVYTAGKAYEPGDGVTWAGSYWIAQRATVAKPDSDGSGFRLAVKRGKDGKEVVKLPPEPPKPVKI